MERFDCLEATRQKLHALVPEMGSSQHLVIKPHLGLLVAGLTTTPDLVLSIVQVFQKTTSDLQVTLAGCGRNKVSGGELFRRSGLAALADEQGWALIDLATEPACQLQSPRLAIPLGVPRLAFTDHVLVSVAPMAAHPSERLSGIVANQLDLFPESLRPDLWPLRCQAAPLATRIWPPDLCVLDARRVLCWHETRFKRTITVAALDTVLIGRDPWAVDGQAARLLGLTPRQVPMLRHADRRVWRRSEQVEVIAPPHAPVAQPVLPSPYAYREYAVERTQRVTRGLSQVAARMVDSIGLHRWVDFARRARGLEG